MIHKFTEGVNFCVCMMCGISFFFDKEDIKKDQNISKFPFVECPHCGHEMKMGWNKDYFKYKKRNE